MKLREGVTREDLYNCRIELSEKLNFGTVRDLLFSLSFELHGIAPGANRDKGFVLCYPPNLESRALFSYKVITKSHKTLSESDLIEPEELNHPGFARCVSPDPQLAHMKGKVLPTFISGNTLIVDGGGKDWYGYKEGIFEPATEDEYKEQERREFPCYVRWVHAPKKGFITGRIYKAKTSDIDKEFWRIKNGEKAYSFFKQISRDNDKFIEPATEAEYLAQQQAETAQPEPSCLIVADGNKEFVISEEQIKDLVWACKVDTDAVLQFLTSMFPTAKCFQPEQTEPKIKERTYSIGDRFRGITHLETGYLLAECSITDIKDKVGLIDLEDGTIWNATVEVENKERITLSELQQIEPEFLNWFELIKG